MSLSRFLSYDAPLISRDSDRATWLGSCGVCPPDGVPGFHQRDARRVSAARPALRGRVPRPMAAWRPEGSADRAPVSRGQKLPLPTPEDRLFSSSPPSRPVRFRWSRRCPGQPIMDSPLARVAGGAPHPRRCPSPLPDGWRSAGTPEAATAIVGPLVEPSADRRASCSISSLALTGRNGACPPQDPAEQTDCYSKKRDHTVKNVLLVNAPPPPLLERHPRRTHDLRAYSTAKLPPIPGESCH